MASVNLIRRSLPVCAGTGSKSISNQLELSFQERASSMTEPNFLSRKVDELKEWQRVAWRRVADPLVTEFERREIRNHIKESDEELRYCLGMVSDRLRRRSRTVGDVGDSLAKLISDFCLLRSLRSHDVRAIGPARQMNGTQTQLVLPDFR